MRSGLKASSSLHKVPWEQSKLAGGCGNRRAGLRFPCGVEGLESWGIAALLPAASSGVLVPCCTFRVLSGSGSVTVNTLAWETLREQTAGKGDPNERSENHRYVIKAWRNSWTLWSACFSSLLPCLPGGREEHVLKAKGFASGAALHNRKSCLHSMKVPLRCLPPKGHQAGLNGQP